MSSIRIITNKPIALDSPDHLQPWGTVRDNSVRPWFNRKLRWWLGRNIKVLDLGCSGGGFVESLVKQGSFAVGIEGSDYSKKMKRAAWATIPDYLFTADITEPFELLIRDDHGEEGTLRFDAITAWEVMEHISEDKLSQVFKNILSHLSPGGIVIFSISPIPEIIGGAVLHQTIEPKDWWLIKLCRMGFQNHDLPLRYFQQDWIRGGLIDPESFNLVLTRVNDKLFYRRKLFFLLFLVYPLNIILQIFRFIKKILKGVMPKSAKQWIKSRIKSI